MVAPSVTGQKTLPPVRWEVGEHVACVGDTGTGKTTLISKLIAPRQFVVVFRTKPDDIKFPDFKVVRKAEAMDSVSGHTKLLLTPRYEHLAYEGWQMFEKAWKHGGWTIVIDELWFVESQLGLKQYSNRLLTQGRSLNLSAVVGMQRPSLISRFAISQCTHLFTFRLDGRDIKTIREATTDAMVPAIENLPDKGFAYYHRARREIRIGNAKRLGEIIVGR